MGKDDSPVAFLDASASRPPHSLNPTGRKKLTCLRAMRLHPPALRFND
jgi:hypothetical protein